MPEELTFAMLRTRKPKRGTCMRCFNKPTAGILQIQVFDNSGSSPSTALVSLTTSMCLECVEIMYRAIAVTLAPAVTFGKQCPGCQQDKPVIGRIALVAKQYEKTKKEAKGNASFSTIANSSYNYCESCTVRMYRTACSIRDASMAEGMPSRETVS